MDNITCPLSQSIKKQFPNIKILPPFCLTVKIKLFACWLCENQLHMGTSGSFKEPSRKYKGQFFGVRGIVLPQSSGYPNALKKGA